MDVLDELGYEEEALAELERVVEGADHDVAARAYHLQLAEAYERRHRIADAEKQFLIYISLCEQAYGDGAEADAGQSAFNLSESLNVLAWLYADHAVKLQEARVLIDRALELIEGLDDEASAAARGEPTRYARVDPLSGGRPRRRVV